MSRLTQSRTRTARGAQRLAAHVQGEVAYGAARRLRSVPERRLEEVMATPLRRVVLDAVFWALPHVLGRSDAHVLASSVRFRLTGPVRGEHDSYWLDYREGQWRAGRGGREFAELTVTVTGADLLALAYGRRNPMREYARGRLRVRGNPIAAARLLSVIRGLLAEPALAPV